MEFESKPVPVTAIQWGGKSNELPGLVKWIREDRVDLQSSEVHTRFTERTRSGVHHQSKQLEAWIEFDRISLMLEPGDYIVKMGANVFSCSKKKFDDTYQKRSTE